MFTSIDKALVAVVMGILSVLNLMFGFVPPEWASAENVSMVIAGLTPVLVWLVPNRS
jgi:hypothetical protein